MSWDEIVLKTNVRFTPSIIGGNIMIRLIVVVLSFGSFSWLTKQGLDERAKRAQEYIRS